MSDMKTHAPMQVDRKTYKEFLKVCRDNGTNATRQVNKMMAEFVEVNA